MAQTFFRYRRPDEIKTEQRLTVDVMKTDIVDARVLVLDHAGETRLHSHHEADAVWFVLGGRARFYDENDQSHEIGPHEGALIPRGTKYWFEAVGDEPLEILRVAGKDPKSVRSDEDRTDMRAIQETDTSSHPHLPIERVIPTSV